MAAIDMLAAVGPCGGGSDGFRSIKIVSPPNRVTVAPVGQWYFNNIAPKRDLSDEDEAADAGAGDGDAETFDVANPDTYIQTLNTDPMKWRDQDHYAMLGLKDIRVKASQAHIEYAYKKQTMWNHPDKKSRGDWTDADRETADGFFTCIKKAYETLRDVSSRRLYDSIDVEEGDDDVPEKTKNPAKFFKNFGKAFKRNKRWLIADTVPELGDDNATGDEVNAFYEFWYAAESWREFGYYDEEHAADNDSREQKRWIEKKNKAARKRKQKEENARMLKLIDNAIACDPRIRRIREEKKQAKLKKEQDRLDAIAKEKEEKARIAREAEEAAAAAEKAEREKGKSDKEAAKRAKKAFVKACRRNNLVQNEYEDDPLNMPTMTEEMVDALKQGMPTDTLQEWCKMIQEDAEQGPKQVEAACIAELEKMGKIQKASDGGDDAGGADDEWTQEEQNLLEKALKEVERPGKTVEMYLKEIAATIPNKSAAQVLRRLKTLKQKSGGSAAAREDAPATAPAEWTDQEELVLIKAVTAKVKEAQDVTKGLKKKKEEHDDFEAFQRQKVAGKHKSDLPRPKGH